MVNMAAKLDDLFEGHNLDEVIRVLAFALSDSVAFATDYVFDEENAKQLQELVASAYMHMCHEKSVTVN